MISQIIATQNTSEEKVYEMASESAQPWNS